MHKSTQNSAANKADRDAVSLPDPAPMGNGQPPANEPPAKLAAPDPFDLEALRLSQDYAAGLGVKKALLTVPVRSPEKSWFIRVHPLDEYTLPTMLLDMKEDRETYLIAPHLRVELATESACAPWQLLTAINRQGVLFL